MIEIRDLCFSFGRNMIIKDLSVNFKQGVLYSIIGSNGSGKTTLLKLMTNQLKKKSGSLLIDGIDINDFNRREFAKKVSLLPQDTKSISISVYDYISSGRYPYKGATGFYNDTDESIILNAAKKTRVDSFLKNDIKNLSGGERQRVFLAAVLAQDTPYILLDEPTTFLDISSRYEIMSLLKSITTAGKSVIAVLHDISLAMEYSEKILVLDRWSGINKLFTPSEAFEDGVISDVFNVKCNRAIINNNIHYIISEKS